MARQGRRRPLTRGTRAGLLLLTGWLATGCTTLLAPPPSSTPAPTPGGARTGEAPVPARPGSNAAAASASLLEQSRTQRAAGDYPQASASLERALRIDPNNPILWIELGELHLRAGNVAQAETMARKALTLTAGDRAVEAQAERLLRAASR